MCSIRPTRLAMRHLPVTGELRVLVLACATAVLAACGGDYGGGDGAAADDGGGAVTNAFAGATAGTAQQVAAFASTVQPVVRANCAACHEGNGPGTPHFAHPDARTAYHAAVDNQKVDLASPDRSRLVRRLVADAHYCWSDCEMNGAEMQTAIANLAAAIASAGTGTTVASVTSSSLRLDQGTEDSGDDRYGGGLIALWTFKEGAGNLARDTSGVPPSIDLALTGSVQWMSNYGLDFDGGRALGAVGGSRKLYDRIAAASNGTQQYSLEAWVFPAEIDQAGPARIFTYSNGTGERNFTLGQVQYSYDFRNRLLDVTGALDPADVLNGRPELETDPDAQWLQDVLQHVVITYDQYRGRRIYVNGVYTGDGDGVPPSRLWNWDPDMAVAMGAETGNNRRWKGRIRLAAVYDLALTAAQIRQNYAAGVGKRVALRFDVSSFVGSTSHVEFEVTEYDAYSYLFCRPTIVGAEGARVSNMRISVNGQIPVAGQAFVNVDSVVSQARQELSRQCSVIAKDQGAASDVFTIEFEVLGGFQHPVPSGPPPPLPPPVFSGAMPDEGLRDFARIRESMAQLTGVDPNTANVQAAYLSLEQQLPSGPDLRTFAASQQMGIANLALEYCDALVESPALRDAFFGTSPAFEWDSSSDVAFSTPAKRDIVIDALARNLVGQALSSQPSAAEVTAAIDPLIGTLTAGCNALTCGPARTRTVVKAACAAVLSSAAVTVH